MSPNPENFTPQRQVRIETDVWDRFGELVGKRHRSDVIRAFVQWYVGEPDVKMPRRPKPVNATPEETE
jgi:hypothetical protein